VSVINNFWESNYICRHIFAVPLKEVWAVVKFRHQKSPKSCASSSLWFVSIWRHICWTAAVYDGCVSAVNCRKTVRAVGREASTAEWVSWASQVHHERLVPVRIISPPWLLLNWYVTVYVLPIILTCCSYLFSREISAEIYCLFVYYSNIRNVTKMWSGLDLDYGK